MHLFRRSRLVAFAPSPSLIAAIGAQPSVALELLCEHDATCLFSVLVHGILQFFDQAIEFLALGCDDTLREMADLFLERCEPWSVHGQTA